VNRSLARAASKRQSLAPAPPAGTAIAARLLAWYDRHRRLLPWRALPGERPDPYRVWLSEIMLQQTTVATVGPYFERFLARWPKVEALAAAKLDEVLHAWQGLGYYARARNLHACARAVIRDHGGRFPDTEAALRALPGVGGYTAAAVAAIAFDRRAAPVDGNIERVVARLFAVETPLPKAKAELRRLAARLVPEARAGDFAQGLMDLGSAVCRPRDPLCLACPLVGLCAARAAGVAGELPRREPRAKRPLRHGVVYWIERRDGAVLLRRRPEAGLLGGLMEFPSSDWRAKRWSAAEAAAAAPVAADWQPLPGLVRHGFTHFALELRVLVGRPKRAGAGQGVWCRPGDFGGQALPTLMKKVARHALAAVPASTRVRSSRAGSARGVNRPLQY
jgi:A/G-specific adenine glycosylase